MGQATLSSNNGAVWNFTLDPISVTWPYSAKTKVINTIGGRVVQVYGVIIGDMTMEGVFGSGGYTEQLAFLNWLTSQVPDDSTLQNFIEPLRFVYPPNNWDFQVYVKSYVQTNQGSSIQVSPEIFNPPWILTLFINNNNSQLVTQTTNALLSRFTQGIGWSIGAFQENPSTTNSP